MLPAVVSVQCACASCEGEKAVNAALYFVFLHVPRTIAGQSLGRHALHVRYALVSAPHKSAAESGAMIHQPVSPEFMSRSIE